MQQTQSTSSAATWAGLLGGALWAVTPLRDLVLGEGEDPRDGVGAFRAYNFYVLVAVLLMSVVLIALLRTRPGARPTKGYRSALAVMLTAHVLLAAGSLLAVLLGDGARGVVMAGQDLGFLAAMVAAVGALVLGIVSLRKGMLPRPAAALLAAVLPLGIVASLLLAAAGVREDLVGLPLTVLYGGAFVAIGINDLTKPRRHDRQGLAGTAQQQDAGAGRPGEGGGAR